MQAVNSLLERAYSLEAREAHRQRSATDLPETLFEKSEAGSHVAVYF